MNTRPAFSHQWLRLTGRPRAAFSLVEVTIAIGIVAFALIPLLGMLSVGLNSYQNSNQRGPAAQAVSQIASCLRLATANADTNGKPDGTYTAAAPLNTTVTWKLDGTSKSYPLYFDEGGNITTLVGGTPPRLAAMLVLTAPNRSQGVFTPGTAQIVAAWPAVGVPAYNNGIISFTSPQGHEESTIAFGPNSP